MRSVERLACCSSLAAAISSSPFSRSINSARVRRTYSFIARTITGRGDETREKRLGAYAEKPEGCSRRRKEADFRARDLRVFRLLTSAAAISVPALREVADHAVGSCPRYSVGDCPRIFLNTRLKCVSDWKPTS